MKKEGVIVELHESGENYLETILILKQKRGFVRSIDIAEKLGFSKPSISRAMSILKKNGLITMNENNQIELTIEGYNLAIKVYERHKILTRYLIQLGVSHEIAQADACRIEHVISDETFLKIKENLKD